MSGQGRRQLLSASVADQFCTTGPPAQRGVGVNGQYVYWITMPMPTEGTVTAHGVHTPRDFTRAEFIALGIQIHRDCMGLRRSARRGGLLPRATRRRKSPPELARPGDKPIPLAERVSQFSFGGSVPDCYEKGCLGLYIYVHPCTYMPRTVNSCRYTQVG